MNILVIGGTGFIGGRLVHQLINSGHRVAVLTRGKTASPFLRDTPVEFLVGDRRDEAVLKSAVSRKVFDAVYDMVAYHPQESELAVRSLRGKVGRFIHCSTISVYMVSNDARCPITEDQDRKPLMAFWDRNPFGMDYGIKKRQCEELLWNAHDDKLFPVSMLRPTFVGGPNDPTKRDFFWIERILDGGPLLIPGSGDFAFQGVFVDDVARAFVALLDAPDSLGKAYNVAGEHIFSLNEYLGILCDLLHRSSEFVHVDQKVFNGLPFSSCPNGDVFPFNTRRTAVFDLTKIKHDLNYRSTPSREWLQITIDWFTNEYTGHSNGYERRKTELEFIDRWKDVQKAVHARQQF